MENIKETLAPLIKCSKSAQGTGVKPEMRGSHIAGEKRRRGQGPSTKTAKLRRNFRENQKVNSGQRKGWAGGGL